MTDDQTPTPEEEAPHRARPGEPVFEVSGADTAEGPMVLLKVQGSKLTTVAGLRPEVAEWLGQLLITAAGRIRSGIVVAKTIPKPGNGRPG